MQITFDLIAALPGQPTDSGSVSGEVLTYNGTLYDLAAIQEGDIAEPEGLHPFSAPIERVAGVLTFRLRWHYDPASAEPVQPLEPPVATVTDGPIPDPVLRREGAEA